MRSYDAQAVEPSLLSMMVPGRAVKVSQIDGPAAVGRGRSLHLVGRGGGAEDEVGTGRQVCAHELNPTGRGERG